MLIELFCPLNCLVNSTLWFPQLSKPICFQAHQLFGPPKLGLVPRTCAPCAATLRTGSVCDRPPAIAAAFFWKERLLQNWGAPLDLDNLLASSNDQTKMQQMRNSKIEGRPSILDKWPPLKVTGYFWGLKHSENGGNFSHDFLTFTKFTFCKKLDSPVVWWQHCRVYGVNTVNYMIVTKGQWWAIN